MKWRTCPKEWVVMAVFLLVMGGTAAGATIYVDADASAGGDGSSWGTAYKYLQDALYKPPTGGDEIWVAAGTYKPDQSSADPNGSGSRSATFQLINGMVIKGGYAGYGEADPNARDIDAYETILSGDISIANDNSDNSYHVFTGNRVYDTSPVLNGFTITAGNADGVGFPDSYGGGMLNTYGSNPTLTNCIFSGNRATGTAYDAGGGGMFNWSSSPTLTNCTFSGNSAGKRGGGMYNGGGSSPTLTNCTFSGNLAGNAGGGMCNWGNSSPTLTNCTFSGNLAGSGGGMYNAGSSPAVANCMFIGNSAVNYGGGMANWQTSSPAVTNCSFSGNSAVNYGGGMANWQTSSPTLTNSTFSDNTGSSAGGMYSYNSSPTLVNCTFSGNSASGWAGGGMLNDVYSNPRVTNCTFNGNSAVDSGGGMENWGSSPTLTNCTFSGNSAGIYAGAMDNFRSSLTVTNCILWDDTAGTAGAEIALRSTSYPSTLTISYSDVQGGEGTRYIESGCTLNWGAGNIDADPMFVDANGPDNIAGTADDNLRLSAGSPCIDAGDNTAVPGVTTDLDGNPRFLDDPFTADTGNGTPPIVDMGAYEYTSPIIFVDADATGANNGMSWADAYTTIQEGIDAASNGNTVLVADGIYTGTGNKNLDFNGKAITVKSENGPANCIVDCESSGRGFNFHTGENANSIVNGFTIRKGNVGYSFGGGIRCENSSPTIANCKITRNYSGNYGGGMYNTGSSPMVINCMFSGNTAGHYGGGMFNGSKSSPTVTNCMFSGNTATDSASWGGGMYNAGQSSPTVTNCTFSRNSSTGEYGRGGGICGRTSCTITLNNSILWGNSATYGGNQIYNLDGTVTLNYCDYADGAGDVAGTVAPSFCISSDPLFVDADGPDDVAGTEDDNLRLLADSNCIDAGDNTAVPGGITTDLDGNPRFVDDPFTTDTGNGTPPIVDIGAYEYKPPELTLVSPNGGETLVAGEVHNITWQSQENITDVNIEYSSDNGSNWTQVEPNASNTGSYNWLVPQVSSDRCLVRISDANDPAVSDVSDAVFTIDTAPVALDDEYTLLEDTIMNWAAPGVLSNDIDVDGDPLTAILVSDVSNGTLTLNADGSFTYTPNANFNGIDQFTYKANDGTLDSNVATVNVTVVGIIYVDADANGDANGASWADAYNYLQDALAAAVSGSEIWVAEGTYKPDEDEGGKKMYWTDDGTHKIQRANLDGSGVEDLLTSLGYPFGITLDVAAGKMYWTARVAGKIQRANLDGSNVEDLVTGLNMPFDIALDVAADKMYWTDQRNAKIQRANLDGTGVEDIVTTGLIFPQGIALDVFGGKMYWMDYSTDKIQRANLDGSSVKDLVTGLDLPRSIALDVTAGTGDRTATFQLKNGVALYGGFAGTEDPCTFNLEDRDFVTNETILSGDLNGDDVGFTNNGDNSYHVVTGSGTDANVVLDGFTITAGNANGSDPDYNGGGMFNYCDGSATVTNCTFSGNHADEGGGGMCNYSDSYLRVTNCTFSGNTGSSGGGMYNFHSSPTVTNCTFSGNSADAGGGMFNCESSTTVTNCTFSENSANGDGGGMLNTGTSSPTLRNCTFSRNSAVDRGGGMYNYWSDPTVTNCTFSENSAMADGGGMINLVSSPTITNCTFAGNSAYHGGGGMINWASSPTITNCTFAGNSAYYGGGIYNDEFDGAGSNPTLTNCILWGNSSPKPNGPQIALKDNSTVSISYCDLQGGQTAIYKVGTNSVIWGDGNIDADPCFVDASNPDPNLRDYHLRPGSPCIDVGDNNSVPADTADLDGDGDTGEPTPWDIDGDVRVSEGTVDMGSDEVIWDSAANISQGETVILNPGGGGNDPNEEALVVFENVSGPNDANITVVEMGSTAHPEVQGFQTLGKTLRIDTSLSDGEFFMTVSIPFDANDLADQDPFSVDLLYWEQPPGKWRHAVKANTDPQQSNPKKNRWQEEYPPDPAPTLADLKARGIGANGVFWNSQAQQGFVWANVDHTTDFEGLIHNIADFEPDGDVDFVDFAWFAPNWMDTACGVCGGADLTGDGDVRWDDLQEFANNWQAGI